MAKVSPEIAYEIIKKKITSGEYYPSQRLVEEQLAKALSLSRHNIRAALQRLNSDGLVDIEPNRGATVASMSLEQALDTLEARKILEMKITATAALKISDELISKMKSDLSEMSDMLSQQRFDEYSMINRRFHRTIYDASGMKTVAWLITILKERMARMQMRTVLIPGRSQQSLKEHTAILDAFIRRNPEDAAEAVGQHMSNLENIIKSAWGLVRS